MRRVKSFLSSLRSCASGNAMILFGMGAPVIIGGAGFAVDTAQFYMVKRELQYAADQAAISGAWAKGKAGNNGTYKQRAEQEFDDNISQSLKYSPTRTPGLADFGSGTDNSVVVTASASVTLPFSQLIMKKGTTISVRSQAVYEEGQSWSPCLEALDEDDPKALWFSGSINIQAGCGVGSHSTAQNSVYAGGNSAILNLDFILSKGGVDDPHGHFKDQTVIEGMENLFDPYEGLTPPDNATERGDDPCEQAPTTYSAEATALYKKYTVDYAGQNLKNLSETNRALTFTGGTSTTTLSNTTTPYTVGDVFDSALDTISVGILTESNGKPKFSRTDVAELYTYTITSVSQSSGGTAGEAYPGTYSDFSIGCDLRLASGVYVIDGGDFEVSSQHVVTGTNVMFVLKNGAGLKITGGADVQLTPMSLAQLLALGFSTEEAKKMEGMLIFEDPQSDGNSQSKITGTSDLDLNGTVYLPKSALDISGNAGPSAQCLKISSKTLKISGNTDLSTFCPPSQSQTTVSAYSDERVRLIA